MPEVMKLGEQEAHLWYVFPEEITSPGLLKAYHGLMSPDERRRQGRFVFSKGRHEYLVARALVRTTLSRYAAVEPSKWVFVKNEYGRPEIASPHVSLRIRFSLSHTNGLIVCLCALDRSVGIDVEDMERRGQTIEIAEGYFSPGEVHCLRKLPTVAQRRRFFEYWTLKEAYIKAKGMGLSLPLDQFSLHIDEGHPIHISFSTGLDDDPQAWQFELFALTRRHMVAGAVCRGTGSDLTIQVRQTWPLRD